MSLTFHQIICDAKKLVGKISDHENAADHLITEIQSVCSQIDNMKEYQEEIDVLNTEAKQRPHTQLIAGIQQETRHLREIQAENKELKNALEDHQIALELIMSKYRIQTSTLIKDSEKIDEMAAVMRVAATLDEESDLKYKENHSRLQKENDDLRKILNLANKYGSLSPAEALQENKIVQTEPE
ncbi:hypothetical protein HCN44_001814 [Aphidius gifuensis]|uniref:FGFR1 oncogene partner 2 homolog n=1 Tax=Aphidius gifuensis TaxID=684658 RepID=A0A835CJR7_APHGI|nr:hypothetical protein HCN44_001814 [Aphidius gifuensis]